MGRPEGAVERHFIRTAERNGFQYFKFTSPSKAGVPDRLIIGRGATIFVELKAPNETPRPLQREQFKRMRRGGAQVYVLDTKPLVDEFFAALLARTRDDGNLTDDVILNRPPWHDAAAKYVDKSPPGGDNP